MKISIIAAVSENNVIGNKGQIPWHLPADLAHFKKITLNHHILMGQKTFESIGRVLPGRTTIVLTNDKAFKTHGVVIAHSPKEAIEIAKKAGEKELMISGGGQIYKLFLPLADKIYLTKIHADFEGDTFFPELNKIKWKEVNKESFDPNEKNGCSYDFVTLIKK